DIGVGGREVGYMFGQYKKLTNSFTGVLTGKGIGWGGSLVRTEATGYGLVYLVSRMLQDRKTDWKGKKVTISGSGNVAIYAAQKVQQLGATVVAMSDSNGYIVDEGGIKLATVQRIKEVERGRIKDYTAEHKTAQYTNSWTGIWTVPCDIALPSATQNEIDADAAKALVKNKVIAVGEGANMPSTPEAVEIFQKSGVSFAPAKAANAGGVATSALEMSQNSMRLNWTFEEVDHRLKMIMDAVYDQCIAAAEAYGKKGDLVAGANIAGFVKVANAMMAQGVV
ncbi:MAG: NADP-specific glutamate dehydrogenase, partial [Planctomycetaceae bacterium]|nr:NADP-specific glutamate dehydrogenase [Planctomycetaceae bacterium]